ncbi:MAG: response regulator transcription factor [Oscillospiraceae bacterium]|jgi:DNA-binding response OmpR family regulator|nr:response regulator transcription factor [Oscillospiraceae bacterium]
MVRILVVEDDTNIRKLICAVLKQHGFEALQADDGVAALEVMDKQHVDLVVLDLMMPNMDGYELTKQIRNAGSAWESLPILMVTAKQEPKDKRQGFLAGTDDYMTKPVDEQEMVLRIKALLRRAKIATDRKLTVRNAVLDYNALTVSKENGESHTLPQKEFQLLFKLLSYPNTIFTRLQLMDEIWCMESETNDHTLNVHINRLRDRFRGWVDFEIITVRGVGYKAKAVKNYE